MQIKGVITGDIVASSTLSYEEQDQLLLTLKEVVEEVQTISALRIEFFRGDSFQILVEETERSIDIAVLIRAGLIAHTPPKNATTWDARLSVGFGTIDYRKENIVVSDGEAFHLSGRGLDSIKDKRLVVATPWNSLNAELEVTMPFLDDVISRWTAAQAEAIYFSLLHNQPQREIAKRMQKSQQAISNLWRRGGEALIRPYLNRCRSLIKNQL